PSRHASRHAHSAASLAWPYASCGLGTVVGSTGVLAGTPNTALHEVGTNLRTPTALAASSSTRVPSTLTVRNSAGSLASGTWATLWYTMSHPATAAPTASASRMSPCTNPTPS